MSDPSAEPAAEKPPKAPVASRRSLFWLLVLAVLAVAGLGAAWQADRVTKDEKFCDSCHGVSVTAIETGPHKKQRCTDCHESKFQQNLYQWVLGFVSDEKKTPHGRTLLTTCKSCHDSGTGERWQIAATAGHRDHILKVEKPVECGECHTLKDHKVDPDPESCARCHDDVEIYGAHRLEKRKEKVRCLSCHNYLAHVGGGAQTPSHDCRRCHGGVGKAERSKRFAEVIDAKAIPPTRIHGNLKTCSLCHKPHEKDLKKRESGGECSRCHKKIKVEFHASQQPEKFTCDTCHEAHGPREGLYGSCNSCHEGQAKQKNTVAAQHDRCSECHKPHEFKATFDGCRKCHQPQTTALVSWDAKTHAECTNCHKPHSTKDEKTTCVSCHRKNAGHQHESCTTCHDPHESKKETKACSECHKPQTNQLAKAVAQHRTANCQTCHAPHAQAATGKACSKCHQKQVQLVSTVRIERHSRCGSCHENHTFRAQAGACNACHKMPTQEPHTGECAKCHQAHGPPIGQAASCRNCHKDVAQPGGKHAQCNTCHEAAHGGVKSPVCESCHQPKATLVKAWPAKSHASCGQCHEEHTPTRPKGCDQCHSKQAVATASSKHRCKSCHDAHKPPANTWGSCGSCHAPLLAAVKKRGKTHSDCQNCHKKHDFKPPTCGSCHKQLPAAHSSKGHTGCNDCHDAHKKRMPSRADCLRCHQERTNHFPEAQSCAGCHLFRPDR